MLRYIEFGLSHQEVPNEASICIYITGCPNRCKNCHYPILQDPQTGDSLWEDLKPIIDLYFAQASCVCLLGEGDCSFETREELLECGKYISWRGLKSCLYSGRDVSVEDWMYCFDYVKLGSYKEECGDLYSRTTNQRFYKKQDGVFVDMTDLFWNTTAFR